MNTINYRSYPLIIPAYHTTETIADKGEIIAFADDVILALGVSKINVYGISQKREMCDARMICYYLIKNYFTLKSKAKITLKSIGIPFNRDHTVVVSALKKSQDLILFDKGFKSKVDNVISRLNLKTNNN